jgi:NADH-quinone oxidoreductase subunit J
VSNIGLYIFLAILALASVGVYGLLPGGASRSRRAAAFAGAAGLGGMFAVGVRGLGGPGAIDIFFALFGAIALAAAARVVTHQRPVYCAIYFLLVVMAVAALLVIAAAEFLAAALVVIYAGAILVTYVFVIMLAQPSGDAEYDARAREPLATIAVAYLLAACVSVLAFEPLPKAALPGKAPASPTPTAMSDNVAELGRTLLTRYVVAIEVAGVLLLVAMIGAVWVARRHVPGPPDRPPARPPGQIGREVRPF